MGHVGIALATTIAGWLNAILLYALLNRRGHWTIDAGQLRTVGLLLASAALMGVCIWAAQGALAGPLARDMPLLVRGGALLAVVGTGIVSFFGFAHLTGAARLGMLRAMLVRSGG